jgi:hypothetical protein
MLLKWFILPGQGSWGGREGRPGQVSRQSLHRVDQLLRTQAALEQVSPPADLPFRIMDSVRETQRIRNSTLALATTGWRPVLGLVAAAAVLGAIMTTIYLGMMTTGPGTSPPQVEQVAAAVPVEAPVAADTKRPVVLDPAQAVVPAGRMVLARVESPLIAEAEQLRRDTQRATEIVLSALPFGAGWR